MDNLEQTIKDSEDYLFPAKRMTCRERSLYYHLLRHTRLIGKANGLFALISLANACKYPTPVFGRTFAVYMSGLHSDRLAVANGPSSFRAAT